MARQLTFDLPARVSLEAGDYFVSDANDVAYRSVRVPDDWPGGKLVLVGPEASGKSHLARILSSATGAAIHDAENLASLPLEPPAGRLLVIEDADRLIGGTAERWLFYAHNHLQGSGSKLLLTARCPPADWPTQLPDLASRLQAASIARIDPPDDALLQVLIAKHFTDRQLSPSPAVIAYLAGRIERSYAAARDIVAVLDAEALATGRQITRPFIADLMDKIVPDG